ncbi:MAG: hypothetical protein JXQ89_00395 [Pelagimonas sp.]
MPLALATLLPSAGLAQNLDDVIQAELRPGWRLADGSHMAALHLTLAPGWKTYWRAPGDAGIPPQFEWQAERGTRAIDIHWPTPDVFHQSGMRSVGYHDQVVLPLRIDLGRNTGDASLSGTIDLGICKDICLPYEVQVSATLPSDITRPDPTIAAALADEPFEAADAGVKSVACKVSLKDGAVTLRAAIAMPRGTGREETVIETADPQVWVAEPKTWWEGGRLMAETRMAHAEADVFALDRSGVRITVLGGRMPVDIRGCDS